MARRRQGLVGWLVLVLGLARLAASTPPSDVPPPPPPPGGTSAAHYPDGAKMGLHGAARRGDAVAVRHLLAAKLAERLDTEVDALGSDGLNPLHLAAKYGHPAVIRALIDVGGARVNLPYTNAKISGGGGNALHVAVHFNQSHVIGELCKRGANANARSKTSTTPLYEAAHGGVFASADALINTCGARVAEGAITDGGFTPLHAAAWMGKTDICQLLLEHGAKINDKHKNHHGTALHMAAYYNHTNTTHLLLRWGARVDDRMSGGASSLFLAVEKNAPSVAKALLQWGADTTIPRHDGMTVFTVLFDTMVNIKQLTKEDWYIDPVRDYTRAHLKRIRGDGWDLTWLWRLVRIAAVAGATFGTNWYLKRPPPATEAETRARLRHVRKQLRKRRG